MPRDSFAMHTYAWQKLVDGFSEADTEAFPHLMTMHAELKAAIEEAFALKGQLEVLNGEVRLMAHRLRDHLEEGKRLEARLRSHLKGTFGGSSNDLIRFGMEPRRARRRRKVTAGPREEAARQS